MKYLNLINALFCETNPAPVKLFMEMAGMGAGGCRLPLGPLSSASRRVLSSLCEKFMKKTDCE